MRVSWIDSSALLAMMARLNERPVQAFTAGFPGSNATDERQHARLVAAATGAEHTEVEFTEDDFWALLPEVAAAMDDPAADYATLPTYKLAQAAREAGLKVVLTGEGGDELFGGYGRYRRAGRPRFLGGRPMRENSSRFIAATSAICTRAFTRLSNPLNTHNAMSTSNTPRTNVIGPA